MESVIASIMNGSVPEDDIAAFLTALAERGETVDEITGAARALRARAAAIEAPPGALDCCGTGGDGTGTWNISTAVSFVAAACGIPVAKHGNRAASSKSGAADVLESLGVNLDAPPEKLEAALHTLGFCFLMAPRHHAAMRHVAAIRKKLGFRTIFNLLGPLANPAGAQYQLLGVYDRRWLTPLAGTLHRLGCKGAWVVHGSDGLDEITLTGPTAIATLDANGTVMETTLGPQDFGLPLAPPESLRGGTAHENAAALSALLDGAPSAYRDIVLLNAAAALLIAGKARDRNTAREQAAAAIDSGAALAVLNRYREFVA